MRKKGCVLCRADESGEPVAEQEMWRVILVDDAAFPGFCRVVWKDHVAEMTDLPAPGRQELMRVVWLVERALREVMRPDKVNLASFGNMVPHLHWHVIPRFADDSHFPEPVWGTGQREADARLLEKRRARLPELKARLAQLLAAADDL